VIPRSPPTHATRMECPCTMAGTPGDRIACPTYPQARLTMPTFLNFRPRDRFGPSARSYLRCDHTAERVLMSREDCPDGPGLSHGPAGKGPVARSIPLPGACMEAVEV
jgi:hypothetical protein